MSNDNELFFQQMADQMNQALEHLRFDESLTIFEHYITDKMPEYAGDVELNKIVEASRAYRERRLGEMIPGYNTLKSKAGQ